MWEELILFINLKQDSICLENFFLYYDPLKVILITHFLQIFLHSVYSLHLIADFSLELWTLQFHQTMGIVPMFAVLFEYMDLVVCLIFFFFPAEEASPVPLVTGFLESLKSLTLNPITP